MSEITIPPEAKQSQGLTQAQLKELLSYDEGTGTFTWKRPVKYSSISAGSPAGVCSPNDYVRISISGRMYLAHRLAWLYVAGSWPNGTIDHIDGCKHNNRFSNLRLATAPENGWNCPAPATNSSGVKGVHWHKSNKKWNARLRVNGKEIHVGSFDDLDQAKAAIQAARSTHHREYSNNTVVKREVAHD